MDRQTGVLLPAAAFVALLHTLAGVDHYLPFVVLGRAGAWPLRRVALTTAVCGVGHVLGSLFLGLAGVGFGVALADVRWLEALRGELAGLAMLAFGLGWAAWSLLRGPRPAGHGPPPTLAGWSLFLIFVLGPCEPLVPLLVGPAIDHDWGSVLLVGAVFSLVTIGAMVALAVLGCMGLRLVRVDALQQRGDLLAGLAIAAAGAAMLLVGL